MDAHKSSPLRPGLHRLAGIAFDCCSMDVHKAAASVDPVYINSPVRSRGRFTRSHRLTTPRPTHLSAPAADSAMIDFSFTMVIVNSAVIITDLMHQVKSIRYIFILYIAFF